MADPIRDSLTEIGKRVLDEAREEIRAADAILDSCQWVSVSEYARIYGVDRATVYKWLKHGGILETYRVGSLRRVRHVPPKDKCA